MKGSHGVMTKAERNAVREVVNKAKGYDAAALCKLLGNRWDG